ncbi:MAG TPA: PilZ domain-containing protein [Vicinamibacterales bacterium]|nr:PilZ domain-containing protein [Vicinamibacterales bacterium]
MAKRQSKSARPNRSTSGTPNKAKLAPPSDLAIVETRAVADPAMGGVQRAERVPILGDAHGEVTVFQPVIIKEISRTGANVQTAFPLHLNSLHDFRLTLGERSVIVKGRVVHCSIADVEQEGVLYRSGIEFVEPSERVDTAITAFIADLVQHRRTI